MGQQILATVDSDLGSLTYALLLILLRMKLKSSEVVIEDLLETVFVRYRLDASTAVSHRRCFPNGR